MAKELHITLTTVQALGLKKLNQTVVKADNVAVRGMINKVSHLLTVVEK